MDMHDVNEVELGDVYKIYGLIEATKYFLNPLTYPPELLDNNVKRMLIKNLDDMATILDRIRENG